MQWFVVARFELQDDLQKLNAWLSSQDISHRFTEEEGRQILWIEGEPQAQQMAALFQERPHWYLDPKISRDPNVNDDLVNQSSLSLPINSYVAGVLSYPVTLVFIMLGICGALLVGFDKSYGWVRWFTFQDFVVSGNHIGLYSLEDALKAGQYWRLITPTFLHFGPMHIIFNSLWVWEFGRRIEPRIGSLSYCSILLMIALVSNTAQYFWQGPSLFGGLSGLVYGLVGIIWMRQRFYPGTIAPVAPGIIGFMLIWLVLCMTGIVNQFIAGGVANAAHLSGLVMGMIIGVIPIGRRSTQGES